MPTNPEGGRKDKDRKQTVRKPKTGDTQTRLKKTKKHQNSKES